VCINDNAGKSDFKIGDKVFGLAYGGAVSDLCTTSDGLCQLLLQYAEKISVSERMLMHMPEELSFGTAAGIPEVILLKSLLSNIIDLDDRHTLQRSKQFTLLALFNQAKAFLFTQELQELVKLQFKWLDTAGLPKSLLPQEQMRNALSASH
jgi:hypothetical protein